jgi:RimJ/RimL family protein N-acetyltransferase
VLRPACRDDVEAFRDLRLEALRTHPEAFGADYATEAAQPLSYWHAALERASGSAAVIFLAVHQHHFLGMVGLQRGFSVKTQHAGVIWGVYVRPAWRGQHLAEALLHACMAWARTQNMQRVKLAVITTNTAAIRCYVRCAFTVYGVESRVICHAGRYYDELLMARPL